MPGFNRVSMGMVLDPLTHSGSIEDMGSRTDYRAETSVELALASCSPHWGIAVVLWERGGWRGLRAQQGGGVSSVSHRPEVGAVCHPGNRC